MNGFHCLSAKILLTALVAVGLPALAAEMGYETLIAHRGESVDAPENTLPAYRTAVERGFGFECDIYRSADGRLFTFHDSSLTRTTDGAHTEACTAASWAETISRVNVGGWGKWKGSKFDPTRPALLEEVLALARPGRKIYVEVKGGDAAVEWVPTIRDTFAKEPKATPETVLFISFSAKTCAELKRLMPEYKAYWLTDGKRGEKSNRQPIPAEALVAKLRECHADGIDICFDPKVHDAAYVKAVKDAGFEFHVWTVDSLAKAEQAFAVGADTLTTNCAKKLLDGHRVATWEGGQRAETLKWFGENQFGVTPIGRPDDQTIGERSVSFAGGKITINIHLSLPAGADANHPVPVFVFGDHKLKTHAPDYIQDNYEGIPTNSITARGYAYVRWNFNDVCPNAALYSKDLHCWSRGVIAWQATGNPHGNPRRTPTSWGTIGAWAWGFSRVMDWIETRPELDAKRVAILGHSRGGKTALWAGAQDERFAMVISNGSGCGGAKLNNFDCPNSEHIGQIIYNFPNWFCQRYYRWIGCDREITHDSDDFLRLIAPRICYVASGSEDHWAGPAAEKAAWEKAHDLWAAYGCPEKMGYHCHEGPHKLRPDDWERFMDFADRHLR